MTALRPLVAGNWKMFGSRAAVAAWLAAYRAAAPAAPAAEAAVFPPFPLLAAFAGAPLALGGQDCHDKPEGAFTGSVSAPLLADLGCRYALVGHSERRHGLGETDAAVRAKAAAAIAAGLAPVICLGETLAEREAGRTLAAVERQLQDSLPDGAATLAIAYEPVWAIGTGRVPTLDDIAAVHRALRARLIALRADGAAVRILYGGSVKPDNARAILGAAEVGGLLVGGASLDGKGFAAIVAAAG
jgi:triosephosphate isomerase